MSTRTPVPQAPGALPLLGHALPLLRSPLPFLASLPRHGDVVRIRLGPNPAHFVCSPELVWQVLLDDRTFDKGGMFYDRSRELVGDGLATCPHSQHRKQRRLLQPAFHPRHLPGYAQVMVEHITEAVEGWDEGRPVDVLTEMMTTLGRVLLSTMFSAAAPSVLTAMLEDLHTVQSGFLPRLALPPALNGLPLPVLRRHHQARTRLHAAIGRLVADYRRQGTGRDDLLSILLSHGSAPDGDPGDQPLSDEEIAGQCLTFFIAGTETAAALLAWAVHQLALHPAVERELHAETDRVLAGRAAATLDDVPHLPVAGSIVTETLRLHSPVWLLTRVVTSDTHLAGHAIPAGSTVAFSPYSVHHDAGLHPDPGCFDPGRWTAEGARPSRRSLIPFGAGARKCVGDVFGITESTLALATIAHRWRLRHIPGTRVRAVPGIVLNPRGVLMSPTARTPVHLTDAAARV